MTRHPYSFISDSKDVSCGEDGGLAGHCTPMGKEPTWHESLLNYMGGSAVAREQAEQQMYQLGLNAGVKINYDVQTNWQPIDSQRVMLWAMRFGKSEEYIEHLSSNHFQHKKSASHHSSILEAAAKANLPEDGVKELLAGEELKEEVWRSYGSTIREKGIHAIPLFIFNGPQCQDGPFRGTGERGEAIIVNGSGDAESFKGVFVRLLHAARASRTETQKH